MSKKLTDLKVVELKAELEKRGMDKSGVKSALTERLRDSLVEEGNDPDEFNFDDNEHEEAAEDYLIADEEEDPALDEVENNMHDSNILKEDQCGVRLSSTMKEDVSIPTKEAGNKQRSSQEELENEDCLNDTGAPVIKVDEALDDFKDIAEDIEMDKSPKKNPAPAPAKIKSSPIKSPTSKKVEENRTDAESKASKDAGKNLWVSNISLTVKAADLKTLFSKYGKVFSAKIVMNAKNPKGCCFGFIQMGSADDADKCMEHLDKAELHGNRIVIDKAQAEPQTTSRRVDSGEKTKKVASESKTASTKVDAGKTTRAEKDDKPKRSRDEILRGRGRAPYRGRNFRPRPVYRPSLRAAQTSRPALSYMASRVRARATRPEIARRPFRTETRRPTFRMAPVYPEPSYPISSYRDDRQAEERRRLAEAAEEIRRVRAAREAYDAKAISMIQKEKEKLREERHKLEEMKRKLEQKEVESSRPKLRVTVPQASSTSRRQRVEVHSTKPLKRLAPSRPVGAGIGGKLSRREQLNRRTSGGGFVSASKRPAEPSRPREVQRPERPAYRPVAAASRTDSFRRGGGNRSSLGESNRRVNVEKSRYSAPDTSSHRRTNSWQAESSRNRGTRLSDRYAEESRGSNRARESGRSGNNSSQHSMRRAVDNWMTNPLSYLAASTHYQPGSHASYSRYNPYAAAYAAARKNY